MKLEGIWKVKEMLAFGDEGAFWRPVQDCMEDEGLNDETRAMLFWEFSFDADGILRVLAPIPETVPQEEIDRAAAAGEVELCGSRTMVVERHLWKEENGKYYYDSGIQGEVMGEEFSPWMEIKETEDGIEWMICRLVKAE